MRRQLNRAAVAAMLVFASAATAAQAGFSNGTLVLMRLGDGTTSVPFNTASTGPFYATSVHLDSYNVFTGALISSVSLPASTASALTLSTNYGDDSGRLNLSPDGNSITFAGYRAPAGTSGSFLTSTNAATTDPGTAVNVDRAIGVLKSNGTLDTSITLSGLYKGVAPTSVVTTDGSNFWIGGGGETTGTGGLQYVNVGVNGVTTANVSKVKGGSKADSLRNIRLIDGKIYMNTASQGVFTNRGTYRYDVSNNGLPARPTSASDTVDVAPIIINTEIQTGQVAPIYDANGNIDGDGKGKLHPKSDLHFLDVNDDGTYDTAYGTGGKSDLTKWAYYGDGTNAQASKWHRVGAVNLSSGVDINAIDLFLDGAGNIDVLMSSDLGVYKLADAGGIGTFANSALLRTNPNDTVNAPTFDYGGAYFINSAANQQFRGLVVAAIPEPATLAALSATTMLLTTRRRRLTGIRRPLA